jgi:hypothetical protein
MSDIRIDPDVEAAARLIATGSPWLERAWVRHAYGLGDHGDANAYATNLALLAQQIPGFTPTPLFNPPWVRRQVGDAEAAAGGDALGLLVRYSARWEREGVSPNPFFPLALYGSMAKVPGPMGLLADFIVRGEPGDLIYFDETAYKHTLGDLAAVLPALGLTAFAHYVTYGWREGRVANRLFDEAWYLAEYPDVAELVRLSDFPNGFSHYLMVGEAENRQPNPFFSPAIYLHANADVAQEVRDGRTWSVFRHLWRRGRFEGWRTSNQISSASQTVFTFLREAFPQAEERDALLEAGRAFTETGTIPLTSHAKCRQVLLDHARPVVAIDAPEMPPLQAGAPPIHGYLSGIALLPFRTLTSIEIAESDAGIKAAVVSVSLVTASDYLDEDPFGLALHGELRPAFLIELALQASAGAELGPRTITIRFVFREDGNCEAVWDTVRTVNVLVAAPAQTGLSSDTSPQVDAEVCLASYAPPAKMFGVQARSILDQEDVSVRLLISDDATPPGRAAGLQSVMTTLRKDIAAGRVQLSVSDRNQGFLGNFERAIGMVPPNHHTAVLLSDQDDRWYLDKTRTLLQALARPGVTCAFSDMRIVDTAGETLSDTFWRQRTVHHRNPISLAIANTVTGAATAVPAATLRRLLPFPRFHGLYHDMWLSVGCAALGEIAYVDRPLYDYMQHGENVLGFWGSRRDSDERWRLVWRSLRQMAELPPAEWTERQCEFWLLAGRECRGPLAQRWVLLSEALRRFSEWRDPQTRADAGVLLSLLPKLGQVVPPSDMRHAKAWRRLYRQGGGDDALLGLDQLLASALAALHIVERVDRTSAAARIAAFMWARDRNDRRAAQADLTGRHLFERSQDAVPVEAKPAGTKTRFLFVLGALRPPAHLFELRVCSFFSDIVSQLALADRLAAAGYPVRFLLLDQANPDYAQAAKLAAVYPQFRCLLGQAELIAVGTRAAGIAPALIHAREVLVATDPQTALLASGMARALGRQQILYLIQADSQMVLPFGAERHLAEASYRVPHSAIFAGNLLATHFRACGQGVFAPTAATCCHISFEVPISGGVLTADWNGPATLLFHAAPHQTEALYEVGIAALRQVARRLGPVASAWRFVAIGSTAPHTVELSPHATLRLERRLDAMSLRRLLSQSQIGLALWDTPSLGTVATEMAAAGLDTVTSACTTKDAISVAAVMKGRVGGTITVSDPTVDAVAAALMSAIARRDHAGRSGSGRPVHSWPVDVATVFPPALIADIVRLGEATLPRRRSGVRKKS